MAQHFKKIIKLSKPKARQVALVVSQYLKDIRFIEMSPVDILEESTREELVHNYMLARCFYGRNFCVRFNKPKNKKPKKPKTEWWIDYNWNLFTFNKLTNTWEPVTNPMYPGARNIFENEDKPTTENLAEKIQELEEQDTENKTTIQGGKGFINELQRLIKEGKSKIRSSVIR